MRRCAHTFIHFPKGAAAQEFAQLQAAQQRLLTLAQHPRQVLHCARVAVVRATCTYRDRWNENWTPYIVQSSLPVRCYKV